MGLLPSVTNLNDLSQIQRQLRAIEERLSELYSIHGKQMTRGGVITTGKTSSIEGSTGNPVYLDQNNNGIVVGSDYKGAIYNQHTMQIPTSPKMFCKDLVIRAYAYNNGIIANGYNLSFTTSVGGEIYYYTFLTPQDTRYYSVFVTIDNALIANAAYTAQVTDKQLTGFTVYPIRITDPLAVTNVPMTHSVLVL